MNLDVVLVQEHWLKPDQIFSLSINVNYTRYGVSAMETQVKQGIVKGRPNGSLATYIRNGLTAAVVCGMPRACKYHYYWRTGYSQC